MKAIIFYTTIISLSFCFGNENAHKKDEMSISTLPKISLEGETSESLNTLFSLLRIDPENPEEEKILFHFNPEGYYNLFLEKQKQTKGKYILDNWDKEKLFFSKSFQQIYLDKKSELYGKVKDVPNLEDRHMFLTIDPIGITDFSNKGEQIVICFFGQPPPDAMTTIPAIAALHLESGNFTFFKSPWQELDAGQQPKAAQDAMPNQAQLAAMEIAKDFTSKLEKDFTNAFPFDPSFLVHQLTLNQDPKIENNYWIVPFAKGIQFDDKEEIKFATRFKNTLLLVDPKNKTVIHFKGLLPERQVILPLGMNRAHR